MDWILEPLQHTHIQRAMMICVLAGFANGYLSAFVVLRKSALQVGSLSHSLLPGVAIGIITFGISQWSMFFGAMVAALLVGLGSLLVARSSRIGQDTALAILYTSAFAVGILLLEIAPVHVDVDQFLFGNILFASTGDLYTVFFVSLVAVVTLTALRRPIILALFEPTAAQALGVPIRGLNYLLMGLLILVLVSSLQAVGCLLALGLLVTPAATVYLLTDRTGSLFWGGGLVGGGGSALALLLSHHLNISAGVSIILTLGTLFVVAWIASPKYGLLSRALRTRKSRAPAA